MEAVEAHECLGGFSVFAARSERKSKTVGKRSTPKAFASRQLNPPSQRYGVAGI
jgi:hypothetical protein